MTSKGAKEYISNYVTNELEYYARQPEGITEKAKATIIDTVYGMIRAFIVADVLESDAAMEHLGDVAALIEASTSKLQKTAYTFLVTCNAWGGAAVYRRVWENNGRYFIKRDGKLFDVTKMQANFIKD